MIENKCRIDQTLAARRHRSIAFPPSWTSRDPPNLIIICYTRNAVEISILHEGSATFQPFLRVLILSLNICTPYRLLGLLPSWRFSSHKSHLLHSVPAHASSISISISPSFLDNCDLSQTPTLIPFHITDTSRISLEQTSHYSSATWTASNPLFATDNTSTLNHNESHWSTDSFEGGASSLHPRL